MLKFTMTLVLLILPNTIYGQYSGNEGHQYADIIEIKNHIDDLMGENAQLKAQNDKLGEEMEALKARVVRSKKSLNEMQQNSLAEQQKYRMSQETVKVFDGDSGKLENEILILKGKIAQLKGKIIDQDKKNELWKLKLTETEYELRRLNLEKEKKQSLQDENLVKLRETEGQLKNEIAQAGRAREELTNEIEKLKKESREYPDLMIDLQKKNLSMQREIDKLSSRNKIKIKETDILNDKKLLTEMQFRNEYEEFKVERENLKEEVEQLESEYSNLNKMVDASLSKKSEKRVLMQSIISLDKENQGLINQINSEKK